MANPHCAHCGSPDTYALADSFGCLNCDGTTGLDGTAREKAPLSLTANASTEQADAYQRKPDVFTEMEKTGKSYVEVREDGVPMSDAPNTLVHPEAAEKTEEWLQAVRDKTRDPVTAEEATAIRDGEADAPVGYKPEKTPEERHGFLDRDFDENGEADDDDDRGSGPYEDRTVEQLKNVARSRNLPVSGTKDELIDSLRGY